MDKKDTNPKDAIGAKKAKLSVIPSGPLFAIGNAMIEGHVKGYRRHNWRIAGIRASVYYDATMGHLMDYWEGQDLDPDSKLIHLAKAAASLIIWMDAIQQGMCNDDRPPRSKVFKPDFNPDAARLIEQYAHLSVQPYTIADTPEQEQAEPPLPTITLEPGAMYAPLRAHWTEGLAPASVGAGLRAAEKSLGDYIARKRQLMDDPDA